MEPTGSFKEKDNRTPEEQELIELRKRNKQLEMKNDILKQAALILDESQSDKEQSSQILCFINVFKEIRKNYRTCKIKVELSKFGRKISPRRIGRIMKQEGLVSSTLSLNLYHTWINATN